MNTLRKLKAQILAFITILLRDEASKANLTEQDEGDKQQNKEENNNSNSEPTQNDGNNDDTEDDKCDEDDVLEGPLDEEKLKRLSEILDQSTQQLSVMLGSLFYINTVKEAEDIHFSILSKGIEEKMQKKWTQLSLQEIEKASTIEEIKTAYNNCPRKVDEIVATKWIDLCTTTHEIENAYRSIRSNENVSDKIKESALEKWDQFSLQEIEKANTIEEIRNADYCCAPSDKAKKMMNKKWDQFSLQEIEKARTVEGIKVTYNQTHSNETRDLAVTRWIELCNTTEQIEYIYYNIRTETAIRKILIEKWVQLCTTIKEIRIARHAAEPGTENEKLIIERWDHLYLQQIEKATTAKEIDDVYHDYCSRYTQEIALTKWIQLSLQEIEKASTVEKIMVADRYCAPSDKVRKAIMQKWTQLSLRKIEKASTVEEAKIAYKTSPCKGWVIKKALTKIYNLL